MNAITLRKIQPSNLRQLQYIGKQTFIETFAHLNTEADMQEYLNKSFTDEVLLNELDNPNSAFYFAEKDTHVIGYLKLNFGTAQTEMQGDDAVEIERIYVLREFHGQKVGQLLYDKAIEIAQQRNAGFVWLGVWEKNERAIAFYEKNRFVAFDKHTFRLGTDIQTDIMMKLLLKRQED